LEAEAKARADRFAQRGEQVNAARAAKGLPAITLRPRRRDEAPRPDATVNPTDPDSRLLRGNGHSVQGYNAQLVTAAQQIIIAAEVTQDANDVEQLAPMLAAACTTLDPAGITKPIRALAADAGYWRAATSTAPSLRRPSCLSPWPNTAAADGPARTVNPPHLPPTTSSRPCNDGRILRPVNG
jgi:hypothetical protein